MADEIAKELSHPSGRRRVLIFRREDGRVTYRWQERLDRDWGPESVDAGVYDSVETAESEARQRVPWLRSLFH